MWQRISEIFCCPECKSKLDFKILNAEDREPDKEAAKLAESKGKKLNRQEEYITEGIFTCSKCKSWYPVHLGIPIFLPYMTPLREEFLQFNKSKIQGEINEFNIPSRQPSPGEEFVMKSFSAEWLDYEYDGTLWTWTYKDRKRLLNCELGNIILDKKTKLIDVGCGIGLTTSFASQLYNAEAVGIDLSLAVLPAVKHFSHNPLLHFVQCSVFALPFPKKSFDYVYSHGVLHHTYDTKYAFLNAAELCKENGITYLWVYGIGSIKENSARKIAYKLELIFRPIMNRLPLSIVTMFAMIIAPIYLIANYLIREKNPMIAKYNFRRAMHAVRDRFTPAFAHRFEANEVISWFKQASLNNIVQVKENDVPLSAKPDFRMNIGIRGIKSKDQ